MIDSIREYWNKNIHDVDIVKKNLGTREFFRETEEYHLERIEYMTRIVDFTAYRGKRVLEVGCGLGFELIRFAKGGSTVTGIDISEKTIELARRNFEIHGIHGELLQMNGENLQFSDGSFDAVYSHGVLGYTNDARQMINEIHRVLKPGGEAILMMYHRNSWLFFLTKVLDVRLEREDSPVFNTYSRSEFRQMLSEFSHFQILTDRFPMRTRLHRG
ncbi:MAG: class I SAM-dependent methyltransferase, partial [Thermodesulfobacteriota bacterium]